ncbi:glycosyltransferase [Ohtaekwangia koreensis]|uniref:Glycosyltransferase, catalytic subunit of cellulose synthase and poly-beta-1,6-N-acetylglucosamine synthase n=1 Tax=Ohtaekwangia koreensis TaxID=688867 RepID=A0A1T5M2B1_9BACT|nr:glycosyltransferase family 2 protein [Ohtaekwangia koreensis]SKC82417.1 Glycosyltransferase, catalytic subunit of cellulose synthase and poly-beta-1,6-N-acetylglucosamine synthase [Ohtaekwangia koreensis]
MFILELIILLYFVYVVVYTAFFAFAGVFYKALPLLPPQRNLKFCVLIPSYKEDAVIVDVAQKALNQNYAHDHYDVVIIADSLQPSTIAFLQTLPIKVIEVQFESSTKVKSLNMALGQLPTDKYDYAVILDADNIMEPDFLQRQNALLAGYGFKAVQGQRKPKNQNTNLAFLDGVSEAINNHVYRQGHTAAGLSSSISGSGVVFDFALLKEKLSKMTSIGGFDRELELQLLQEGIKVYYYKDAVVYDEKISQASAFQNQRKRWISSQYFYLRKYFKSGMLAFFKGNFTFFNSAILRNIQLPRLINLGLLTVLTALAVLAHNYLAWGATPWVVLFTVNTIAVLISIPGEFYSKKMLKALLDLPGIFVRMFLLLFKLKNANKKFIHTPHGATSE